MLSTRNICRKRIEDMPSGSRIPPSTFQMSTERKVSVLGMLASWILLEHSFSFSTSINRRNTPLIVIVLTTFSHLTHLFNKTISRRSRSSVLVAFWRVRSSSEFKVTLRKGMVKYSTFRLSLISDSRGLAFESSATEGAILAIPDATFRSDLKDLDRFYQQIGIHAESWYSYANGPGMGHRVRNGDLCLVIGCDKTTSWGIMTFSNSLEQTTSRFQFQPVTSSDSTGRHHTWEHSGTADSLRVGPGGGRSLRNQCLFVRYLNIKLRTSTGLGFNEPTGAQIQMESHQSTSSGSKRSNSQNLSSLRKFGLILSQFWWSVFSPSAVESEAPPGPPEDSLEVIVRVEHSFILVESNKYDLLEISEELIFLELP